MFSLTQPYPVEQTPSGLVQSTTSATSGYEVHGLVQPLGYNTTVPQALPRNKTVTPAAISNTGVKRNMDSHLMRSPMQPSASIKSIQKQPRP